MISKKKLIEYAKKKNYNLGQAEIDYYQEIILFILYQEFGKEVVFKGGTALTKCYGFDRFSEDLDFTTTKGDFEKIISVGLKKYYIEFTVEKKEMNDSINITYKIKGPLYSGQPNTTCKIDLDFSTREEVLIETNTKRIGIYVDDIPSFDVVVMSEEEIFSEKIRAIITRNKARDLYDIYYLIKRNTPINIALINKKLSIYNLAYTYNLLKEAVESKKGIWEKELRHLVKRFPEYSEVKKTLLDSMRLHISSSTKQSRQKPTRT
jgi:hypothetical protein